jgi:hypothetical protein
MTTVMGFVIGRDPLVATHGRFWVSQGGDQDSADEVANVTEGSDDGGGDSSPTDWHHGIFWHAVRDYLRGTVAYRRWRWIE